MKKILSIALLASLGFSANLTTSKSKITIMPYIGYVNYAKSIKRNAIIDGLYASYFNNKHFFKIETDAENTKINYNGITPKYNQTDFTVKFSHYFYNHYAIRAGIHNIFVSQTGNSNHYQKVLFGGLSYYKYLNYNVGVDYYYSFYRNFHVQQITPKIGFNFGNLNLPEGSFYTQAKINYIHISDKKKAAAIKNNYWNIDLKFSNTQGQWTTTLKASLGKNAYKVENGGFVVYNLGEEYKYTAGLNISYEINKNNSVKVGYNRSKFEENNKNAYSNIYTASYMLNF